MKAAAAYDALLVASGLGDVEANRLILHTPPTIGRILNHMHQDHHDLIDNLCREVIRITHGYKRIMNDPDGTAALLCLNGEIVGLRMALCMVMGWDPRTEADKEERADDYIKDWHNRNYPDEEPW